MLKPFKFKTIVKDKNSEARTAILQTPHGEIQTPCYIPVGTQGSVKGLSPFDLKSIGAQILLANTYHLHLRPTEQVVSDFGQLGNYISWDGPTMTDSGGFQVFSLGVAQKKVKIKDKTGRKLSKFTKSVFLTPADSMLLLPSITKTRQDKNIKTIRQAKIEEDGVWFYSHINGSKEWFDAKKSITIQEKLGADLIVAFDDHESPLWDMETTKLSLERTNRWAISSLKAKTRNDQLMYGVIHGGAYKELRIASAQFIDKNFEAIAIGGSYSSKEILYSVLDWVLPYVDEKKPRHLLGIGEVQDLFEGVGRGIDFFDCVAPTRRARHGSVYISFKNGGRKERNFTIQIKNQEYINDKSPIDPGCLCFACSNFTRGYINHLLRVNELLGIRLTTYHNVYFITKLMKLIRNSINDGSFHILKKQWLP